LYVYRVGHNFFYLTWRRNGSADGSANGSADFNDIWHAGRAIIGFGSMLEKIGPDFSEIGTTRPKLLELLSEYVEFF